MQCKGCSKCQKDFGRKIGMTQVFTENGQLVPVTVIEATPNVVVQVKNQETDGYEAIQVGFGEKRRGSDQRRARPSS